MTKRKRPSARFSAPSPVQSPAGRKPLDPGGEVRSIRVTINLTPTEHARLERACSVGKVTPHDLLIEGVEQWT